MRNIYYLLTNSSIFQILSYILQKVLRASKIFWPHVSTLLINGWLVRKMSYIKATNHHYAWIIIDMINYHTLHLPIPNLISAWRFCTGSKLKSLLLRDRAISTDPNRLKVQVENFFIMPKGHTANLRCHPILNGEQTPDPGRRRAHVIFMVMMEPFLRHISTSAKRGRKIGDRGRGIAYSMSIWQILAE